MKVSKLVKKLNHIFDKQERERQRQREELKEVLRAIKSKQRELEEELEQCTAPELCKELEEKISILLTQRRKVLEILKDNDSL